MTSALITGVSGQDGSYLAELLLSEGYKVYGLVRSRSSRTLIPDGVRIIEGDMADSVSLCEAVQLSNPDYVYNLAAQTFVPSSWTQPELTADVNGMGVLRLLEAIRRHASNARFYQASTSELYGNANETPQSESTHFLPRSPYGVAKLYGHHIAISYRESYRMFIVCGICFNHESPRRPPHFVTKKIAMAAASHTRIRYPRLNLGNLDAKRDWGWAPDFVKGMKMALEHPVQGDYVFATGQTHSVREFAKEAYTLCGLDYNNFIRTNDQLIRPAEVDVLQGDYSKARDILGWEPTVKFENIVTNMVEFELAQFVQDVGYKG
ncbi:MAG: GDP-mannose 4,6-dehydratase [Nitrososphaera sp.]